MISLVSLGFLTACGNFSHSTPEEKAKYIVEEIEEELELQNTQLDKLNALKDHILELRKEHLAKKDQKHKEVRALLDSPVLDQTAVLSHISDKTAMINGKAPEVVSLIGDFYDSLNEIQQDKIRKKADKFSKYHKKWHH